MTTTEFLDTVAKRAYSTRATIQATYDIARAVLAAGTPGDFVECGVAAGSNAAAMARAIWDMGELHFTRITKAGYATQKPRVHLFDSFEGIPQAGPEDHEYLAAGHKAGLSAHSLESVKAHMREWEIPDELLVWHPGWFAETIPPLVGGMSPDAKIALLRLDGDLYESTKVCMEHLYPLVSNGGWVICDDYALSGCRKAVHETVIPGPIYWRREW
jgi:O-methyltransferase